MEFEDILISGKPSFSMENPEKPGITGEIPGEDALDLGKEKIKALKDAIAEIKFLIKEREELSKSLAKDVEKIKLDISNFLLTTEAVDADGFRERNGLRQKQIEMSELQLNERVGCWRDVSQLKRELRDLTQELNEKEERLNVLGRILEE